MLAHEIRIFSLPMKMLKLACAMPRRLALLLLPLSILLLASAMYQSGRRANAQTDAAASISVKWRSTRSALTDLEVAGDLVGQPAGSTQFLTRADLLAFPQVSYLVSDDANLPAPVHVSGVPLGELLRQLSAAPQSDLVVAISKDLYWASYPQAYIAEHHPLLVLTIDGKGPEGWPKAPVGNGYSEGPYLISHPKFIPSFKILTHSDEPQIPWGVVRIEFRSEKQVLGTIAPRGPHADAAPVQAGYRIAQQNCFRCHNMGNEGGQKARRPWPVLAAWATSAPGYFGEYVCNPQSKNAKAEMPGFPNYDDTTIQALVAYFQTFVSQGKP